MAQFLADMAGMLELFAIAASSTARTWVTPE
jgi:hypothetical protein